MSEEDLTPVTEDISVEEGLRRALKCITPLTEAEVLSGAKIGRTLAFLDSDELYMAREIIAGVLKLITQ